MSVHPERSPSARLLVLHVKLTLSARGVALLPASSFNILHPNRAHAVWQWREVCAPEIPTYPLLLYTWVAAPLLRTQWEHQETSWSPSPGLCRPPTIRQLRMNQSARSLNAGGETGTSATYASKQPSDIGSSTMWKVKNWELWSWPNYLRSHVNTWLNWGSDPSPSESKPHEDRY